MFSLTIRTPQGAQRQTQIGRGVLVIGRHSEVDLRLPSKRVSRRHAQLECDGKQIIVSDLGSQNGTFLNGQRVLGAKQLRDGDRLTLGDFVLRLSISKPDASGNDDDPSPDASSDKSKKKSPTTDASFRAQSAASGAGSLPWDVASAESGGASLSLVAGMQVETEGVVRDAFSDNPILDKLKAIGALLDGEAVDTAAASFSPRPDPLSLFSTVSELINSAPTPEAFLEEVLGLVCMVAAADLGAVILIEPSGELKPLCRRQMTLESASDESPISRTIVETAIAERALVTTHDASQDARFGGQKSVALMGLRSVLCVPLLREEEVPAVFYLTRPPGGFTREQQMSVAAVAQLAGMGLDRSRLHAQMAEEERLRRVLSRFHAPEVVEAVIAKGMAGDAEIGSKMVSTEATVIFCDICGFTSLAEAVSPQELATMLNAFYHAMTEVVFEQLGTVDKYIGDCVMSLFGVPVSRGNDALRAVEAALQMQLRFARLQETAWAGHPAKLRVGVNTGPLMAGTVGSALRLEYTALGDAVNVAQRLESIAAPSQILAGPRTAELVRDHYHLHPMQMMQVKGRKAPVEVFEILGRHTRERKVIEETASDDRTTIGPIPTRDG